MRRSGAWPRPSTPSPISIGSWRAFSKRRIQYDGYNRHFKILDHELAGLLEDGDVYALAVSDSEDDSQVEWLDLRQTTIAHA